MPVQNEELLKQVHFTGEAGCSAFKPHPLRPSFCTECMKLFSKHTPQSLPDDETLLQAIAYSQKSESTPDCILSAGEGLGGVYLGGYRGVVNDKFLKTCNITHVVNTALGLEIFGPKYVDAVKKAKESGINFLELNWEDTLEFLISEADLATSCKFIHSARERGGSVLVHCAQGKSRSSTAVIAYLMVAMEMSFLSAKEFVQSHHKMADPNPAFAKFLMDFEKSEALLKLREEFKEK